MQQEHDQLTLPGTPLSWPVSACRLRVHGMHRNLLCSYTQRQERLRHLHMYTCARMYTYVRTWAQSNVQSIRVAKSRKAIKQARAELYYATDKANMHVSRTRVDHAGWHLVAWFNISHCSVKSHSNCSWVSECSHNPCTLTS